MKQAKNVEWVELGLDCQFSSWAENRQQTFVRSGQKVFHPLLSDGKFIP